MSASGILRASGGAHGVDAAVAITTKRRNINIRSTFDHDLPFD